MLGDVGGAERTEQCARALGLEGPVRAGHDVHRDDSGRSNTVLAVKVPVKAPWLTLFPSSAVPVGGTTQVRGSGRWPLRIISPTCLSCGVSQADSGMPRLSSARSVFDGYRKASRRRRRSGLKGTRV